MLIKLNQNLTSSGVKMLDDSVKILNAIEHLKTLGKKDKEATLRMGS